MERFSRIELLIGEKKLAQIQKSKVVVIGLGAVGSYVVEALTRAGVGWLRLIDFDQIHESNLNRQLFALESTLGKDKTDVARARVLDINSKCQVETLSILATSHEIEKILDGKPDLVIDAIDAVGPKAHILAALIERGVPVISSMGAALRTDPSRVKAGDLFEVRGCRLARFIRKRLRKQNIHAGVFCVYSDEQIPQDALGEKSRDEDMKSGRGRHSMGSLPTITGIFGLTVAHYALQQLCDGFQKKGNNEH